MFINCCLLFVALCLANVQCKVVQPTAEEHSPKNKKIVGSNEEFGPDRAAHEIKFGNDEMFHGTVYEESIIINSMPFKQITMEAHESKGTQTTNEEETERNAVIAQGNKKNEAEKKASSENSEVEDKKENENAGLFTFLWALFGGTPSKKEVEKKNKEIVGDDENNQKEYTTTESPQEDKVEQVLPKSDVHVKEAVKESHSETKVQKENKHKEEKRENEKKHKNKADKLAHKVETPATEKKQAINMSNSEKSSKFSDELMKSDIIDSEGSSESSISEENEKDNADEKKGDEKNNEHQKHHHEETKSGFIHFGLVKTLALVTAGPALIIAVVVLISRGHMKKRDSTMM